MSTILKLLENPAIFGALTMLVYTAVIVSLVWLMFATTKPRKH